MELELGPWRYQGAVEMVAPVLVWIKSGPARTTHHLNRASLHNPLQWQNYREQVKFRLECSYRRFAGK